LIDLSFPCNAKDLINEAFDWFSSSLFFAEAPLKETSRLEMLSDLKRPETFLAGSSVS
jgi:hypothetical protein